MLKFTNHETESRVVIDRLSDLLGINEKGEVTIDSIHGLRTATDILATFINFSAQVVERQRRQITYRGVIDAKKSGNLNPTTIRANIEEQQKAYLRKPVRKFVLLTSASFQYSNQLRSIRVNDCTLTFSHYRPTHYPLPDGGSLIVRDNTPSDYCYVQVHVSARDPYEATERAFEQIDLLRAIWNLHFNLGPGFRITHGRLSYNPINRILPGPFHTLHYPDGKLALTGEWFHTPLAKDARGGTSRPTLQEIARF
jgi:hypothetical protein